MKKLGFFALSNRVGGGGMVATENAIKNLLKQGHKIVLFVENFITDENIHQMVVDNVTVIPVGKISTLEGEINLINSINEHDIEIFITHCHYHLPIIKLFPRIKSDTRAKIILCEHHYHFIPLYEKREPLYLDRYKYLNSADLITVIEPTSFRIWKASGYPVALLPNTYYPTSFVQNLPSLKKKQVILSGRFVDFKQMPVGIAAFAYATRNHPDWELVILGAGNDLGKSKALAKQLDISDRVNTIGWTNEAETYFRDASIHLLPSYTEPFGLVTLDAKNASIPTIMFDLPSNPLVTNGLDGYRVPVGDEKQFADRITRLINDEELRYTMGKNARQSLLNSPYMPENTVKVWTELFQYVSGQKFIDEKIYKDTFVDVFKSNDNIDALIFDYNSAINWYAARRPRLPRAKLGLKKTTIKLVKNWKTLPKIVYRKLKSTLRKIDRRLIDITFNTTTKLLPQNKIFVWDSNGVAKFQSVMNYGLFKIGTRKVNIVTPYPGMRFTLKMSYNLARARYFITNTNTRYTIQVKKLAESKTQVINIWHGSGFFKHFGIDENKIGYREFTRRFGVADRVMTSSVHAIPQYSSIFGISENNILPYGSIRTDLLINQKSRLDLVEKLYEANPILRGKKIYVFAPTWRGAPFQSKSACFRPKLDMKSVAEFLNEDEILVIKNHQLVTVNKETDSRVSNIIYTENKVINGDCMDLMGLTAACDVFISDFSSAYFDAMVIDKPVFFYADDVESYLSTWSIYDDYEEYVPGELLTSPDAKLFVSGIRNSHNFVGGIKYTNIKQKHLSKCDGKASSRLAEYLADNWDKPTL